MRPFLAALRFLTILPVPESWAGGREHLARSAPFFPAVGLLIGALMAAADYGLRWTLPPSPAGVLTVIGMIAISGGLHLDGLADTADGMLSSRPRERILEIMKDSRTGPMGVAAVVCVIALKLAALSAVPDTLRFATVLMMPLAGRCAIMLMMSMLPSARQEGSLTSVFRRGRASMQLAVAIGGLLVVGWLGSSRAGLTAGALCIAASIVLAVYVHRRIGGFTGDTLGAACEIVEIVPALTMAAWAHGFVSP
jgi:adenosylcobinamide-GDP ribazoletransferase